jgi:hypothetical protein
VTLYKIFIKKNKKKTFICFFIIVCSVLCFGSDFQEKKTNQQKSEKRSEVTFKKNYKFTRDWVSVNSPWLAKHLDSFRGKPDVHYLEIGVYEGRCTIWMLENILTHPSAKVTAIDLFPEDRMVTQNYKDRFFYNIKLSGFEDKVTTLIGMSQIEMRKLPLSSFDIIYVDGSHLADDVLADAVLAWPLLKIDGILIFDDYNLELDFPVELRPRFAINAFIITHRNYLDIVHFGRQIFIKKRDQVFKDWRGKFFIPVGQYMYHWRDKKLFYTDTKEPVDLLLTNEEKALLEQYIKSRDYLDKNLTPNDKILKNEAFIALRKKLDLDIKTSGNVEKK